MTKRRSVYLFKRTLQVVSGLFLLYVIIVLIHGTYHDFQPEESIALDLSKAELNSSPEDTLDLLIWNIGYGGLGAKQDFFYHGGLGFVSGGKTVQPRLSYVEENLSGVEKILNDNKADFYLLQEVDVDSKRSHYINEYEQIGNLLNSYSHSFAPNYLVKRVPVPLFQPWNAYGKAHSGLATFSRFQPKSATRIQLPGNFSWPMRIFQLDRCLAISRFDLAEGKELVIINIHNSAFDRTGKLKSQQTAYFRDVVMKEYEKGNYVIAGGDWNQSPPYFKFDGFMRNRPKGIPSANRNIPEDLFPADWTWAFDPTMPTCRSNSKIYQPGETFIFLIDFYLLSPNVTLLKAEGVDHQFAWSDHQPVKIKVKLN